MRLHAFIAALFAVLLAATPVAVASVERVDLDEDTPLVGEDAVSEYEDTGSVERELDRYAMTISYYDDLDETDVYSPSMAEESGHEWLVVCYEEDIDREIRLYVPDDYFTPVTSEGVQSETSDATADFEPTTDRKHTAVTVTLNEPGCHVFGISKVSTSVYGHWESTSDRISDFAGADNWTLPGFGGGAEWSHIDGSKLDSETVVGIDHAPEDVTVQYRASSDSDEERWRPVPEEESSSDPVHTMTRDGEPGTTYVVADSTPAPQVRWTTDDPGVSSTSSSVVDDVMQGVQETLNDLSSILP
jgi:hypothetical protein